MNILKYSKFYYAFSIIVALAGIAGLIFFGLNLSIDFTGGSLWEINSAKEALLNKESLQKELEPKKLENLSLQQTESGFILRFKEIDEKKHQDILAALKAKWPQIEEMRFDTIGPVIGEELKRKSIVATIIVLTGIALYVAFAFRKASRVISGWRFGVITLITLAHDVLITIGLFSIGAHYFHYEVGVPFVAALLTVLGFSVHDTIVVFDRIRENIFKLFPKIPIDQIINSSLRETFARSFNTSFTTLLPLVAIFFLGGATLKPFIFTLIIGIIFGTYSSIFIASPLLNDTLRIKRFSSRS